MEETPQATRLFTTVQAANFLHVERQTIRQWVKQGKLPAVWSGRQLLFDEVDLRAFLRPVKPVLKSSQP
jgi:excisionase family DNA binding protein